ncbi:flotillin [Allocatelliglobosispora scoriae]|uniref:Flotillin n=1 Tax=Allocatelliglobosispora scoriae TaxID=643052 RepID=A0A841BZH3_9ACTN|nr:SPFH domain-containing protein [Allocatelliglobosispora scoriae]MBB5872110.1 flotillin [Allocatelliglobosispora scoriae]
MTPLAIAIVGALVLVLVLVLFVISRIKVAGPNEAFIVTGRKGRKIESADGQRSTDLSGQKVVMGASVFVLPIVQKLNALDLSSRRLHIEITGAVSKQGIRANLQGVAIVKVGGTEDAIRAAAQRFLDQQAEIEEFTREVLAGALRSIVGRLTVEEIIRDRAAFASAVAEEAEHSMTNQGLVLDTFQLQDILAEGSYLQDLGRPEAARVLKDAAIAEALARQQAEQARLLAEESIAEAQRNLALKKAAIQAETDAAEAVSKAAGPLAEAERQQVVLSEQQKVAERNAELKQRQLDTEVRKPADAARYKVEQEAEADRNAKVLAADGSRQATIAAAQANAEQARLMGEGERARRAALAEANAIEGAKEGEAEQRRRTAIAEAVEREGQASASAILANGQSEAEAMRLKAEAFSNYNEAAILDLLVRVLPQVVASASAPMGNIDKLTVISTDGASSLTKSVASNVAQGLQLGTDLTGIDLPALLARLAASASSGDSAVPARPTRPASAKGDKPVIEG